MWETTPYVVAYKGELTLAELETLASAGLAVLLAFFHTRIAREEPFRLQDGAEVGVQGEQRPGDAMANRADLARGAPAANIHMRIELVGGASDSHRLHHLAAHGFGWEIVIEGPAVDGDLAGPGGETDAGDSGLAAAGAEMQWSLVFRNLDVGHTWERYTS